MQTTLLSEGVTLMIAGMGTVFVFLTVLVIAMSLMSAVAAKLEPASVESDGVSDDEVAAIAAAIATHTGRRR